MTTNTDFRIEPKGELQKLKHRFVSERKREANFNRLVLVSNRLPIAVNKGDNGRLEVKPTSDYLVTAVSSVLWNNKCLWIGWPGSTPDVLQAKYLDSASKQLGCILEPVILSEFMPSEKEFDDYYLGFSNQVLWPLFHGFPEFCRFNSGYWYTYQEINRKFAHKIARISRADDYIWVQDYNFMLLAKELHDTGIKRHTGFFLHMPFPNYEVFRELPWKSEIIEALLNYDMIGFQTGLDRDNFLRCVEEIAGLKCPHEGELIVIYKDGHRTTTGVFPVGIDFSGFERLAASRDVEEKANQFRLAVQDCQFILGVDHLNYSSGIPLSLQAYGTFLERFKEVRGKVVMTQIILPGPDDIPEHQAAKVETESLVRKINETFGDDSWVPARYIYGSLDKSELAAYYRTADIALINPVMDRMNLVPKEYCAASIDNDGVLILSEFSGSAGQLRDDALMVNPDSIDLLTDTIYQAYQMPADERSARMLRLRQSISRQDIHWWSNLFLRSARNIARSNIMCKTKIGL